MRLCLTGLILLWAAGCASAGESVVLANGSRLRAERHEAVDDKVRLYLGSGYIELEASQIQAFEIDEAPAPATPADGSPAPAIAAAPPALTPLELADAAADKYGLPRKLVRSLIAAESAFQTNALSPKGAIGLMQLMPGTAQQLGANPYNPAENVDAGTRYLRELLEKYEGGLWRALAAYNAGPAAVEKYKGIPPYRETINYVNRIDREFRKQ
jgi:soluble lytic murein transglycosylase-like protein